MKAFTANASTRRAAASPTQKRIVYQAAPGEKVEIKGSEVVKNWVKVQDDVWKVTLPNSFFGSFNPYSDLIHGDWFNPKGREHHTGAVYLNGDWLTEAAKLDDVLKPAGTTPLWFGQVDKDNTTIWAQFKGVNPNEQLVEINVRRTVFYPEKPGMNYITVRGFTLRHAATPWAPPTAEQIGLIGTHWSKGWIIENNVISHSICSGIALGKYGDQWDNTSANTAEGYVKTIERALAERLEQGDHRPPRRPQQHHLALRTGGHRRQPGRRLQRRHRQHHPRHPRPAAVLRRRDGGHQVPRRHRRRDPAATTSTGPAAASGWTGWRRARASRATCSTTTPARTCSSRWTTGRSWWTTTCSCPAVSLLDMSEGGAYAHNLLTGQNHQPAGTQPRRRPTTRRTRPRSPAWATSRAATTASTTTSSSAEASPPPSRASQPAKILSVPPASGCGCTTPASSRCKRAATCITTARGPTAKEAKHVVQAGVDPKVRVVEEGRNVYLHLTLGPAVQKSNTTLVTTELLGKAKIPGLPYENPDGSPLKIDTDYFGKRRNEANPTAGPFENPGAGPLTLKVW